jgi:hypothetical protein
MVSNYWLTNGQSPKVFILASNDINSWWRSYCWFYVFGITMTSPRLKSINKDVANSPYVSYIYKECKKIKYDMGILSQKIKKKQKKNSLSFSFILAIILHFGQFYYVTRFIRANSKCVYSSIVHVNRKEKTTLELGLKMYKNQNVWWLF